MPCGCVLLAYLGLSTIWDGPPRTLHFEIEDWSNLSWGLHDIDRRSIRCEVAVASDGSRMNQCEYEMFHHYFLRYNGGVGRTVYTRFDHAGFAIDDAKRTARGGTCSCTWEAFHTIPDDDKCRRTAQVRLPDSELMSTGHIAGYETVEYRLVQEDGEEIELSLAPAITCEVMEEVHTWPGTFGIPGAKWRYQVNSYQAGEPDQNRFRAPYGYNILHERE
jgi:hypothetical protein